MTKNLANLFFLCFYRIMNEIEFDEIEDDENNDFLLNPASLFRTVPFGEDVLEDFYMLLREMMDNTGKTISNKFKTRLGRIAENLFKEWCLNQGIIVEKIHQESGSFFSGYWKSLKKILGEEYRKYPIKRGDFLIRNGSDTAEIDVKARKKGKKLWLTYDEIIKLKNMQTLTHTNIYIAFYTYEGDSYDQFLDFSQQPYIISFESIWNFIIDNLDAIKNELRNKPDALFSLSASDCNETDIFVEKFSSFNFHYTADQFYKLDFLPIPPPKKYRK